MKKITLILIFICAQVLVSGQSINNYVFSTGNISSLARTDGSLVDDIDMTVGTTPLIGGSNNAIYSAAFNIGFDYYINGTRQTQFNVTSNGWVGLPNAYYFSGFGWLQYTGMRLAPFLTGTNTNMGTGLYGRVHYKVVGSAPSRVCVIEFLNMVINSGVLNDTTTFQCRLYEQNGEIEYVYGAMRVATGAPVSFNVGFQLSTTVYQSVNINTHTSSSTTSSTATFSSNGVISQLNSFVNGSRRNYKWIPSPPNDPTNLTFSAITGGGMTLSWTASSNALGYVLYKSLDGGVTYSFVNQFPTTTLSTIQTGLPSNTDVFWRLYAFRESIGNNIDGDAFTLSGSKIISITSGNWSDTLTWSTNAVPTSADSVLISTGNTVTINRPSQSCGNLEVSGTLIYGGTAAAVSVNGDVIVYTGGNFNAGTSALTTHTLAIGGTTNLTNLAGNLTVNGTFDMNTTANVNVTFFGIQNATISGTGATCDFATLTENKGNSMATGLDVVRVITMALPTATIATRINITNGTFRLSSASNITPFYGAGYVTFNPTARFWVNHPGAIVNTTANSGGYIYFNSGELRIDNGTVTLGSGSYPLFMYGNLNLNGGTLNLLGGLYSITSSTSSTVSITGGNMTLDPQASGNLQTTYATFYIASSANLNWTGGNVTILNPHSAVGGSAVNIASGGSRIISGGTLSIGDGTSNKTSGALSNTTGFGILSSADLFNLTINNNISASNTRMVRMLSDIRVTNQLTVSSNSYIFTGSGTTGYTLRVGGNLTNDGTIAGTQPTGTQTIGSLSFEGTSGTQTLTGGGSIINGSLLNINHTGSGVVFTNSVLWSFARVNLKQGSVATGTKLSVGNSTTAPTIQIGGIDELTSAGSFVSLPIFNTSAGNASYIYGPTSSTLTAGAFNEMPGGAQTLDTLTVLDANGLVANRSITVSKVLNLNGGNFIMGTNNLSLGTSAASAGLLNRTSGFVNFGGGTFTRWYANGSQPSAGYPSGFPISSGNNERTVQISTNGTLTSGGSVSVQMNDVVGFSTVNPAFSDGSTTINRRSNANWIISGTGINLGANTLTLSLSGQGIGAVTNVANVMMVKSNSIAPGTALAGTGTNTIPQTNRSFIQSQLFSTDTFFVGSDSTINPMSPMFTAIADGNWSDATTWDAGTVPTNTNDVLIPSPYTVTLTSGTSNCKNLSITPGGTLTANTGTLNAFFNANISGTLSTNGATINITGGTGSGFSILNGGVVSIASGNINIGTSGGSNQTLNVAGTLNMTGGNTTINGNFNVASGSNFNQSGGTLTIDGNSGTAATSVPQGTHLCNFATNTMNCSGGTIIIVDPPHSSYFTSTTNALRITASASTSAFSGTHTFQFGDGISSTPGNNNGFSIDTKRSGVVPIQNIIVNGGNTAGRWVSTSYSAGSFGTHMKGNLTINSGCEFRHTTATQFAIGGNINNDGIFTATQIFTFGGIGYVVTNADTISGTGTFRNSIASPTGSFTSLTIDNGSSLTLATNAMTFTPTATLALGANTIVTNNNIIRIPPTGTLTRTTGFIIGSLSKYFTVGSNVSRTFELGAVSGYLPAMVIFPSVTTAGDFIVTNNSGNHSQIASSCLDASKSILRNWTLNNSGVSPSTYNLTVNYLASDPATGINLSNVRYQIYSASNWNGINTATAGATSAIINGLTSNGDLQLGELNPFTVSISINASASNICNGTSVTFTATPTNGGATPTYQWKKNGSNVGTNSTIYSDSTLANNDHISCSIVSSSICAMTPNATSDTITMTVSPPSVGGTVSGGGAVCTGSTSGTLTLSGHTGSVLNWESSVSPFTTWTSISNTSTTYTSGALTQTTQFRAVVQSGACSSATSSVTTVTIDQTSVGGSVTGGTTICSGSTSGTLTLNGQTGSILNWESSVSPFTTWTSISNTATTYTSGALSQTTQFRAVVQSGSCASANSSTTTVTVDPSSVGGSVTGGTTICTGSTSGTLTLSGHTGTILNWESSVSPFTSWTSISNTSSTYTSGVLTQTTQFRAVVQSGSCSSAASSPATVTVSPLSVGGSVTGGSTICSGSTSGTLALSGNTGSVLNWESSVSPFTTWTSISNTATTYISGALTQNTQFRAVVQSGSCTSATSSATTVTITTGSVGGNVTGGTTICSGSTSGTLTLSGHTGTVVSWLSATAPFNTWTTISNTSTTYTSGALSQTTQFRALVQNGSCVADTSTATTVTVNPSSDGGSVTGGTTICSGQTSGTLTLSGQTGTILKWQSSVSPFTTWTDISNTSTTYTSGALTQTTQFRAVVQSGSCTTVNSTATTVTVDPTTVGGSVTGGATICSGSTSGTLTLSGHTGTILNWESSVSPFTTWTSISNTATTYTSGALTQTTQFRAVVQSGSCAPANSSATTVTVDPTSVGGSVSGGATICSGLTSGTLTLSGNTGTVVKWQSSVSPFTTWTDISNTTTTYTSGALTQTTQFRAVVQSGSCSAVNSSSTTVTVNPASVGGSVTGGTTICSGSTSGILTLSGNAGTVLNWLSATAPFNTWNVISNTTTTYTSVPLTQTTQFRALVQNGSCTPDTSTATTVTVTPTSVGGSITGGTSICSGQTSGTLTLSGHTGTILNWESSVSPFTSWNVISNTSATYTSAALTQTTQFRAVVQSGSCASATSSATTVTVNSPAIGGSVNGTTNICTGTTSSLILSGQSGSILKWQSATTPFTSWTDISNTTVNYTSATLTQNTAYRAVMGSGSCPNVNSDSFIVEVAPLTVGGAVSGGSSICTGSSSGPLTLSGQVGKVIGWESAVSPFTTWTSIADTHIVYSSLALSATTAFRAIVQSGNCASANSDTTTVIVTAGTIAGTITGAAPICSGSTAGTLTVTGLVGIIDRWESSVSPFITWTSISNTTTTHSPGVLTQTTQFRVVAHSGSCSSGTLSPVTINVSQPTVAGNVTGGTTICSGSTSALLTLSGNTGSVINWESSVSPFTTWTSISNTTTSYISGALTQTTQFRAVVQSGVCASANSSVTTVTVNPTTVGGSVTGGTTICTGQTSGILTLSGNTGAILNWEYSVSPFTTWTSISNTFTTYTSGALTQTTQFRAVVQSGVCASAPSLVGTVTVSPTSIGGSVSGGTTICSGQTSGTLTLSGNTGSVISWLSSVSPFTTWTSISNTTTTYTSGSLTQTTQFKALVQSGACIADSSSTTTVTVIPSTVGGSVTGGTSICSGSTSGTLTLSGNTGTILNWEYSVSPFTTWTSISNTSSTYTSGALTQTTQFRAVVQSGSCTSANSSATTVTVDPTSVGGSISGGTTICSGSTSGNLTLNGQTGTVLNWEYSVSPFTTWTSISNTAATYTSGSLTQTTQFRAVVQSGSCTSANSSATTVTVDPTSVGGSISGGSTICSGQTSGTLTLNGNTGTVLNWESSVSPFTTWTSISNTVTTYTSGALTQTTQFRAVVQSGSCASANSSATTVTVDPTSVGGSISGGSTICSGQTSGTLTLSGNTGTVLNWESSVSPFTTWTSISNTATTYTSGALTQTTQFRAVVQSGSCTSANSSATAVTVDPTSVGGSISGGTTICSGQTSGTLTLSGNTGTVLNWESSVSPFTTWTSISNTATTYTSGALTQTTQFRAVVQSGSCTSANSSATTVTVTPASVGGSVSGGTTICSGSTSGTLTLSGNTGSVVSWLSATAPFTSWTSIANTTTTFTSGALTQTTQFRALVQNGSCTTDTSSSTTVTVDPTTVGGSVTGGTTICSGQTGGTLTLSGQTGSIVKWQSSISPFTTWTDISNTTTTYTSSTLTQTTQFRAVVQSGSCTSANSSATTVTVDPTSVGGSVSGGTTICSGQTSGTLTLSGNTGTVLNWESSVSPFTTWTSISNTTTTYTSGALTQTTQFRAVVQSGSCTSANSSATTVTVAPSSVGGSISGGTTICSGQTSGTLTLSGNTGSVVSWLSSVSPFTTWTSISNTSTTYTSGSLTQTTQFRALIQNGSCTSDTSSSTTVTVIPASVGGTVSGGTTICSGQTSGTLTLSGNTGTVLNWESSVSPFTTWTSISNTATTYTSGALTQTTQFRAVVQSGSCTSANSSATTVTVDPTSVGGSISGGSTICSGQTSGTLTLSGNTGTVLIWESSVSPFTTWTSISNTTTTYTSGALTQTTQFRAVVQSGSCTSANSSATTVTVDPTSVGGSISGGTTICSGQTSGTLTLSGQTGTITKWQSSVSPFTTWTDISNTTTTYTSGALTQTTQFRAVVQSGSCTSANSSATTVTVTPASVGGSVSGGTTICSGSTSGTLTLSGNTGSVVSWLSATAPFTSWTSIANTTITFTSGALTQTTQFRALVQNGSCTTDTSSSTTVTVDPTTVGGSVTGGTTICSGQTSGTLTLSGQTGTITKWQSSVSPFTTWTDISNTTTTYTSGALTQTTQFRAVVQSGSCTSANSSATTVTVDPTSVGGSISGGSTICSGQTSGTLTLSGNTGTVLNWESSVSPFTTWTSISNTATTYTSGSLTQTTQFRAIVQSGSCTSANSSATTVTVAPSSVGGSVSGGTTICSGQTSGTLTLSGNTGSVVSWLSSVSPFTTWTSISNTSTTYTSGSLTQTTQFRALVQNGSCTSDTSSSTTVTVIPASVGGTVSGGTTICSGSTSGNLTLNGQTGTVLNWEYSVSPFTTWTSISNTTTTFTSGALTQTTQYRAVVQSGSCASATSSATTVTVSASGGSWLGTINNSWKNPANWCGGTIPTATSDATINSGTPYAPIIDTAAKVNNINIGTGVTVLFSGSGNSLDIQGSFTNSGTLSASNGTVIFGGASAQTIPGMTYGNVTINGGSVKTLTGNATVNSTLNLNNGKISVGTNNLTIGASGSISGGSATSFIITDNTGKLIQNNVGPTGKSGNISYPVGSSSASYTPAWIINTGTTDNFGIHVIGQVNSAYTGETPTGTSYTDHAVNKTWLVSEGTTGGSTLTMTLQWNGSDELTSFTRNNCGIAQYNGTIWSAPSLSSASGTDPYIQLTSNINTMGPFGIGDNLSGVPVTMLNFNAKNFGYNVLVEWKTASEINNNHFEIERSVEGNSFNQIGIISGSGTTNKVNAYSFEDVSASEVFAKTNIIYYRLKQVDNDGKFTYSEVASVLNSNAKPLEVISVHPNPFNENFVLNFSSQIVSTVSIELTDMVGKTIYTTEITSQRGLNKFSLPLDVDLRSGVYFVKVIQDNQSRIVKVVKQN